METAQDTAVEAPRQEETPAIVEQAFGKQETAPSSGEPSEKKAEGSPDSPKEAEPPSNTTPAATAPKSESRSNRRIQSMMAEMNQLKEKLAKYENGGKTEALSQDEAIDKRFAELQLESMERQRQEDSYNRMAEAFPDEEQLQDFIDLAEHYGHDLVKYAPRAAQMIADSELGYKMEKAFYDVCSSTSEAFKEFLNKSYPEQRKLLQGLEAFIKSGKTIQPEATTTTATTTTAPTPPANLPKSITPSDSGTSAGETDAYEATIRRITEERKRASGR
jgi:hypothetical protein